MRKFGRKVRTTRTGTRLLRALIGVVCLSALASCQMTSTIKVHQNQGQGNDSTQVQDVEIKHEGMLNSLALSFVF